MPDEELNCIPVYVICRSNLSRDDKPKNEYFGWENLPELNLDEA